MLNDNLFGEITTKEALAVVRRNGRALICVPLELKTAELCLEAVKQDGYALRYVPENLRTAELCLEAIKNLLEKDLEIVPEALREEVRRAIKNGG